VVRAEKGRRDLYKAIVTPLSTSPDAVAVATGLRKLYPFPIFYVADLDAIGGGPPNAAALAQLKAMREPPELWLDAGLHEARALEAALEEPSVCPVLGSESQRDDALLRRLRDHPALILSLDFFADGFRGPASLLDDPALWPQRVIVMTLARVGSNAGPDFVRLKTIKAKAGNRMVIAAGGVRHQQDIRDLTSIGIAAALVASSLHNGTISSAQLASLA
jgi:phosphoribosylformimino-5-aminoimidazole carboxamide ribotide isomerase